MTWVFLPLTYQRLAPHELTERVELARSAGFPIVDLSDVYNDVEPSALAIAPWDAHPNQLGHQLLADTLLSRVFDSTNPTTIDSRETTP